MLQQVITVKPEIFKSVNFFEFTNFGVPNSSRGGYPEYCTFLYFANWTNSNEVTTI